MPRANDTRMMFQEGDLGPKKPGVEEKSPAELTYLGKPEAGEKLQHKEASLVREASP